MKKILKKIIKDWFTESDNDTFDIIKALAVASIITAIGLSIIAVVLHKEPFSFQDYGMGAAALFAGVGVALGMKKDTDIVNEGADDDK